jgi:uncharacterized protein
VLVVDVHSPVQALPALAVHEPAAQFRADAAALGRAAARMRYASVGGSAAQRTGPEQLALALAVTDELLAPGAELMTLLTGAGAHPELAERVLAHVREVSPATEIECHAGAAAGVVLLAGAE